MAEGDSVEDIETDIETVERLVSLLLDDGVAIKEPLQEGIGLKVSIGELFSGLHDDGSITRVGLQFHVEASITGTPSNSEVGFTEDDVVIHRYATLCKVPSSTDRFDPPEYNGRMYPLDYFLSNMITDPTLKNRVVELLDGMEEDATPDEEWLDEMTSRHYERRIGTSSMIRSRNSC